MDPQIIWNTFSTLNQKEWSFRTSKKTCILTNNYTGDQFSYQSINLHSLHLLEMYKTRVQYKIPNTPQIILSTHRSDAMRIQLLVQEGSSDLKKFFIRSACCSVMMNALKTILQTVQILVKKFGFFRITQPMLKFTHAGSLILWVNSSAACNHRELPFACTAESQGCRQILKDIFSIFRHQNCEKEFQQLEKKLMEIECMSFEKIKAKIEAEMNLSCSSKGKHLAEFAHEVKKIPLVQSAALLKNNHTKKKSNYNIAHQPDRSNIKNHQFFHYSIQGKSSILMKSSTSRSNTPSRISQKTKRKIHQAIESQQNKSQDQSIKKGKQRDSANSTSFFTSISSSGKTRFFDPDLTLSIGKPSLPPSYKSPRNENSSRINIKVSKIIEERNEDLTANPYYQIEDENVNEIFSDLEKQFDSLLSGDNLKASSQCTKEIKELEKAFDQIMNG